MSNSTNLSPAYLAEDKSSQLVVTNSIVFGLAAITVLLRFVARKLKSTSWGVDDYLIALALIWVAGIYATSILSVKDGIGHHIEVVAEHKIEEIFKLIYIMQLFYILSPATIKLSVLFLYKRIYVGERFIRIVYAHIILISLWVTIMFFMAIFNCTPISAFWTNEGKCFNFKGFAVGYAIVNILTDVSIWILPLPKIWELHLPIGQKMALMLIFTLGLFEIASALTRLVSAMLLIGSPDPTWDYMTGNIWSVIEPAVGIMCACLPTTRVVLLAVIPKSWHSVFSLHSSPSKNATSGRGTGDWPRTATYNEIQIKSQTGISKKDHSDAGSEDALELRDVKEFGQQEFGDRIMVKQEYVVKEESVRATESV
ncbi:uncharacterized protein EAE97_005217 [Botrytis byssoidea]|uniref:Rhodopsin domain-containing protein n=1 Tax=Botrytis byssoidea TaxID=139641 RepID=A0A9P5IK24_9HELO|nr:uncharacterized protein EAE97_005217 [Botrytis byssoidea]KAF7944584.1 hypothetical protein EAE97_005217 [Botrytis byssoidea]